MVVFRSDSYDNVTDYSDISDGEQVDTPEQGKGQCCGSKKGYDLLGTNRYFRLQQLFCRLGLAAAYVTICLLAMRRVQYVLANTNDKHEMAWTIGGAFVVATVPISLHQIFQHLTNFVEPRQQTHVIRMISMVPLYAIQSWFSLRYPFLSLYTQCIREAYEAYVIYAFVQYLINYMGSEDQLVATLQIKPAVLGKHMVPFCCLPPWTMGEEFLTKCKVGVLQYLGIRFSTMIITFVLEYFGSYGEGDYSIHKGFFWVTILNCCSQTWALYILILFYHATHKELIEINPCGKFFSIKSVVFASWWQSLLIGLMVHQGTIGELDSHSAEMVAKGVQDLLICTEMLMAAIAFQFSFPVTDFTTYVNMPHEHYDSDGMIDHPKLTIDTETISVWSALWRSCIPLDVREEFRHATKDCMNEDGCMMTSWNLICSFCKFGCRRSNRTSCRTPKGVKNLVSLVATRKNLAI